MDELVRGWNVGIGVAQLAKQHGLHRSTVGKYLQERGIKTREVQFEPDDLKHAAELYDSGWTLVQVAIEFGVSKKTIRKRLAEAGVVIRRGGRGGTYAVREVPVT